MARNCRTAAALALIALSTASHAADTPWRPQINLVNTGTLPGSFVSAQGIYADSERIYVASHQGDLFVLERDRFENFPWTQTVSLGSPLTAVRGDDDNVYVTSRDGHLYVLSKTWPLQLVQSIPVSSYGLAAMDVVAPNVYVAKGQGAMTVSKNRVYLSELNPGDTGIEMTSMRSYGDEFEPNTTRVFDRRDLQFLGAIPHSAGGSTSVAVWQDFVYLTTPGCCGIGIDIYDAPTLKRLQFINRSTNTVAGTKRKGVPLLVGGTEAGFVDLYMLGTEGYQLVSTANLRELTGFNGSEDIEIRSLWVDGLDNLIFAGSSWGNDESRSPELPSFFALEIR